MSDFLKRFKNIQTSKKNTVLLIVSAVVLSLAFIGGTFDSKDSATVDDDTNEYAAQYIKKSEKELESLISKIDGVGKTEVMITLESCYENVYARGYTSKKENDEDSIKNETQEEYILVKKGSNNEECLVVKVYEPTVKGVAVVAQGVADVRVETAVIQTVCALYGISSAKVSVEEMTQ